MPWRAGHLVLQINLIQMLTLYFPALILNSLIKSIVIVWFLHSVLRGTVRYVVYPWDRLLSWSGGVTSDIPWKEGEYKGSRASVWGSLHPNEKFSHQVSWWSWNLSLLGNYLMKDYHLQSLEYPIILPKNMGRGPGQIPSCRGQCNNSISQRRC